MKYRENAPSEKDYKKLFLLIGVLGHLKIKHFTDNDDFSYGKNHFQRLLQYIESGNFN